VSEPAIATPRVPRVSALTQELFVSEYMGKNQPVIVTGGMRNWKAPQRWTPEQLTKRLGNERVQVYGDLFRLMDIKTLSEYFERFFNRPVREGEPRASTPYVRWYCHLAADERVPWADDIFAQLTEDWARPDFFPSDSFVLPFCAPTDGIDPTRDWFPAKGLFISGRGARTRTHADPWSSDALLCQIYGRKEFVMYHPSQSAYLVNGDKVVDVETPDPKLFPNFSQARASVRDALEPGEILFVPAGWYHHFNSVSDSISLTWNFVHASRLADFLAYLAAGPAEAELKQLAYAYFESPGHHKLEGSSFISTLMSLRAARLR